jgi:poly(3-hydroxybutyrate) depolymerase
VKARRTAPGALLAVALAAQAAAAQSFPRGELIENLATARDPSQTYTLYLPKAYDPARVWPLLLVLDPRGRGTLAADIFRDAAERHGWILVSSNGTQSDTGPEPNRKAIAALWPEIQERVRSDPKRIYLAGYSGTVMLSWLVALDFQPRASGVIASCGRLDNDLAARAPGFAQFSATGSRDFNHLPTFTLDARVAASGQPHRLRTFDGGHEWLGSDLAEEAIAWLDALAMRDGLRERDDAFLAAEAARDLERARGERQAGRLLEALEIYRSTLATFDGLADLTAATRERAALESSREAVKARTERDDAARWENARRGRAFATLLDWRRRAGGAGFDEPQLATPSSDDDEGGGPVVPGPSTSSASLIVTLDIGGLHREARGTGERSQAAQRVLASLYAQTASYLARDFEAVKQWDALATLLETARAVRDDNPELHLRLARARALGGQARKAVAALEAAFEKGYRDANALAGDPELASLRKNKAFLALLERMRAAPKE